MYQCLVLRFTGTASLRAERGLISSSGLRRRAAAFALVAIGFMVTAIGAGSDDITVCQEHLFYFIEILFGFFFFETGRRCTSSGKSPELSGDVWVP